MKSLKRAVRRHPELPPVPTSVKDLLRRFASCRLIRCTHCLFGRVRSSPNDAFRFGNLFPITEENGQQIRDRFQNAFNTLVGITEITVQDPVGQHRSECVGDRAKDRHSRCDQGAGSQSVAADLIGEIGVKIADAIPGRFGRCGGMAFAGYDFFLHGYPVDARLGTSPPGTGALGNYIFDRLLDSLELNALRFMDLVVTLHVLPVLGKAATIALLTAAGSIGGPIGAAIGAFVGTQVDIFQLGGPVAALEETRRDWSRLKDILDHEAAVPVGYIYGTSVNPIDQHQVLAIGYKDTGNGEATLTVWDNHERNVARDLAWTFAALNYRSAMPQGRSAQVRFR